MEDLYKKIVNEKYIGDERNPINQKEIFELASNYSKEIKVKHTNNGIALIIVDAQRDFIDTKKGVLPIKGAVKDIERITRFIFEKLEYISAIYTTFDTHEYNFIFHPFLWRKRNGDEIEPFTEITLDKIIKNEIVPLNKKEQIEYLEKLDSLGKQNIIIWPYHCIYATDGWLLDKQLNNMLLFYERAKENRINKIMKGKEQFSDMYGAVAPEVITNETRFCDMAWVYGLKNYNEIYICGESKDFGVYETVRQLCEMYSNDKNTIKKINVMMNCCSAIFDNDEANKKFEKLSSKYGIKLIEI
ncbi:nicotinamidase [uncultured Brachyspira sp.]|uniref:nicotinamidase n=1 Tax=uncultured Brachyspira sp. TaxID=221953 RepID=UPI00261A1F69|nr:nicotinamidase [uncultured Brachyspira sp.]